MSDEKSDKKRVRVFECIILIQGKKDKKDVPDQKALIVGDKARLILAATPEQANMLVAREIPEEFLTPENIDRVEVAVRPF